MYGPYSKPVNAVCCMPTLTHTVVYVHAYNFTVVYFLQACAKEGAQVIATDVNAEKLAELQGTEGVSKCVH